MAEPMVDLAEASSRMTAARDAVLALIAAGSLDDAKSKYLSQKGEFRQLQKLLGQASPADRPTLGKVFHEAKTTAEAAYEAAVAGVGPKTPAGPTFDFLPALPAPRGGRHPLVQTIDDVAAIFGRMGFRRVGGPEIEDVHHNFVALNIPADHPARDPRDNFTITDDLLLRSQTSTVQIRVMESEPPPLRIISIGRVYRPDQLDATHAPMFHQVEGLLVDESVTLADLKTTLRLFTRAYLGEDVAIRFRASFFPFTEPSIEVDMRMTLADGRERWVELGGCGMVDPAVFEAVGVDPERYTGFAF
ncbi:MAG: phenylalanine--tRNA ligase subunit alpha, partial [Planctomycetia bacterium]